MQLKEVEFDASKETSTILALLGVQTNRMQERVRHRQVFAASPWLEVSPFVVACG